MGCILIINNSIYKKSSGFNVGNDKEKQKTEKAILLVLSMFALLQLPI
jgi:hypothetical protein